MTILELSGELEAVLHGTTLNKITNIYGVYNRAARQLLLDLDPQETKRICELTNPIYNKVYDYALPTDLKGNRIIDIRPQVNRTMRDNYAQLYGKDFDISKEYSLNPSFDVQFNSGVKTIRINSPLIQTGIVINYAEGITGNGTWAVDGVNATTLTTDSVNYVGGQNSLKFNLTNTGVNPTVGYIENSTMSAVDLSSHENQSSLFFYVYLPDASDFTNLILRWGSSTASYWTATATTDFFGNAFVDGWNLIRVNWTASTTEVGTPNSSAVNYLRISYTYDGVGQTAVRLNNIVSNLGQIMEIVYYSKYLFRSAAGRPPRHVR